MHVNPKITIPLAVFVGAAGGALQNDPATTFMSIATAERAVIGAALVGFIALAHWLMDPKPPATTPVFTELKSVVEHVAPPVMSAVMAAEAPHIHPAMAPLAQAAVAVATEILQAPPAPAVSDPIVVAPVAVVTAPVVPEPTAPIAPVPATAPEVKS